MTKEELATILFCEIAKCDCEDCMFRFEDEDGAITCKLNLMSCLSDGTDVIRVYFRQF